MTKKIIRFEEGDGGITYAMCFIAIVLSVALFSYFRFNMDVYVLKEKLETGLHVAESAVLTANQSTMCQDGIREDEFDRESYRYHIITSFNASNNNKTDKEEKQLKLLAKTMADSLADELGLANDKYTVENPFIKSMTGENGYIKIKNMEIYEPVYKITTTSTGSAVNGDLKFKTIYTPVKWIKYVIFFNNNTYSNSTKEILDISNTPKLYTGQNAKGATLQVTLGTDFYGLKNIFAKVGSNSSSIFTKNPEEDRIIYSVNVTLAMDIVLADNDDRAKK